MTNKSKRPIDKVIREARIEIRVSQDDFASMLGVSRRTLSRWEMGDTVPDAFELAWLVEKLHAHDRPLARRVARELAIAEVPVARDALEQSIVAAADSMDVSRARMRAATAKLVERWREAGLTLDEVAATLAT